jgi:hypothetical protein
MISSATIASRRLAERLEFAFWGNVTDKATRQAPAQTELRPTCALLPGNRQVAVKLRLLLQLAENANTSVVGLNHLTGD